MPLPSLLLLPPPPSPITPASFAAAYRPSITAAISTLGILEASDIHQLFLVIPCPALHNRIDLPRPQIYDEVQQLLRSIYSLICVVGTALRVDLDSGIATSIDARVVLLDYSPSQTIEPSALDIMASGPIVNLPTLAITRREWYVIFSVEGEESQKLLNTYTDLANGITPALQGDLRQIKGGVSMIIPGSTSDIPPPILSQSKSMHRVVAVGGTFDHIHAGHKLLLTATALLLQPTSAATPRRLIVGITGDDLLKKKKYAEYLKSWEQRQSDVVEFFKSILSFTLASSTECVDSVAFDEPGPNGKAIHTTFTSSSITIECVEIQDPFGPTVTDESITALVVSGETRSGGQAVNEKRGERGWKPLEIFEVDVLDAQEHSEGITRTDDFAAKISSTAIRQRKAEASRNPRSKY